VSTAEIAIGKQARAEAVEAEVWHPKRKTPWRAIARHAVLILMCLWVLLPLAWVLLLSIKSIQDGPHNYILPKEWAQPISEHYKFVLTNPRRVGPVWDVFKNSVLVTTLTVIAATVTAVLGGYALTLLPTPGRRILLGVLVASLFFPTQVTALTGIYIVQDSLELINVTWGLFLPYTALSLAISVFIMRGIFQGVPKDLLDSATIDGASSLRALVGVILPLVRNGVVVVIIVNFVFAWGEYLLAATLMNDLQRKTLPVFLSGAAGGNGALFWPRMAALYVIAVLPALITFALAQRWYMKGLQEGALKG
jgi:ABC-type glycerol-3-phosphate transport system permease component